MARVVLALAAAASVFLAGARARADEPAPEEPAPSEETAPGDGEPSEPPTGPAAPIDIDVSGKRRTVSAVPLTQRETRSLPGAFGDAFRAIEILPGVTPVASGVPYFFVRGAPPANVGYFLDGMRVPLLYHVALGPSVIHPALIDRVELYPGAAPARYGRFTGGIIAGESKEPAPVLRGESNFRLFDCGSLVEAPLAGGKVSLLGAFRYSYAGALVSLLAPQVQLGYADYQARASWEVTPKHRLTAFAFGSHDVLRTKDKDDDEIHTVADGDFHRVDLRHDYKTPSGTRIRHAATFGFERSALSDSRRRGTTYMGAARSEQSYRLGPGLTLGVGGDVVYERFQVDNDPRRNGRNDRILAGLLTSRDDVTAGTYLEMVMDIGRLQLTPGVRVDLFTSDGAVEVGVDPRLIALARITDRFRILGTVGVASQAPSYLGAVPGLQVGGLQGGLQRSFLTSAGISMDLPYDMQLTANVFRNAFFNMSDALGNRPPTDDLGLGESTVLRSLGRTHGLEVFLRRPLSERLGGFLSYTLSQSTRQLRDNIFDHPFDRRHVLQAAASLKLGRGWSIGQRLVFYSGTPTYIDYRFPNLPLPTLQRGGTASDLVDQIVELQRQRQRVRDQLRATVGDRGLPDRLPPFFRLDLRVEKRWVFAPYWLALILEVQNAFGGRETLQYRCDASRCLPIELGPIVIPSLGLEAGL
jgi:hypothetical protein